MCPLIRRMKGWGRGNLMDKEIDVKSVLLLLLFTFLLVAGINAGEVQAVWKKAIKVCLSCMGLG